MDSSSNIMGICFIGSLEIRRLARRMGKGLRGYGLWLQPLSHPRARLKLLLHKMDMDIRGLYSFALLDLPPAAAKVKKELFWGHPRPRQRAAALCTPMASELLRKM